MKKREKATNRLAFLRFGLGVMNYYFIITIIIIIIWDCILCIGRDRQDRPWSIELEIIPSTLIRREMRPRALTPGGWIVRVVGL